MLLELNHFLCEVGTEKRELDREERERDREKRNRERERQKHRRTRELARGERERDKRRRLNALECHVPGQTLHTQRGPFHAHLRAFQPSVGPGGPPEPGSVVTTLLPDKGLFTPEVPPPLSLSWEPLSQFPVNNWDPFQAHRWRL